MTTKLEFVFQAGKLADDETRRWSIESKILPATAESDPGSTKETKDKEHKMAETI